VVEQYLYRARPSGNLLQILPISAPAVSYPKDPSDEPQIQLEAIITAFLSPKTMTQNTRISIQNR